MGWSAPIPWWPAARPLARTSRTTIAPGSMTEVAAPIGSVMTLVGKAGKAS